MSKVIVEFTVRETARSAGRVEVDTEEFERVTGQPFHTWPQQLAEGYGESAFEELLQKYVDETGELVEESNREVGDDEEWANFEVKAE